MYLFFHFKLKRLIQAVCQCQIKSSKVIRSYTYIYLVHLEMIRFWDEIAGLILLICMYLLKIVLCTRGFNCH